MDAKETKKTTNNFLASDANSPKNPKSVTYINLSRNALENYSLTTGLFPSVKNSIESYICEKVFVRTIILFSAPEP